MTVLDLDYWRLPNYCTTGLLDFWTTGLPYYCTTGLLHYMLIVSSLGRVYLIWVVVYNYITTSKYIQKVLYGDKNLRQYLSSYLEDN